jgi:hypothetical protein
MYSVLDLQKLVQMLNFLGFSGSVAPPHYVVIGGGSVAPGAAGTLLASNGASADPSFQALGSLGIQPALGYTPAHAGANADITSVSALTTLDGAGAGLTLTIDDHTSGNGALIKLMGNGATTPAKYIQSAAGFFALLNNALAEILNISDAGAMTFPLSGGSVGVVATSISALRAVLKTGNPNVFVTGYYAPGDGGGGQYWYNAADTTSADNGGTIIVASDGGRWYLDYTDFVTSKQFGCKADGSTNDTTALNAAIAAVSNLRLSVGKHLVSTTVGAAKSNFTLSGSGQDSQILTNSATADVLDFGDGTNEYQNIVLRDFSIDSTVSKTAGVAITLAKCTRSRIKNVFMSPPENATNPPRLFWGIYCAQFDYTVIEGCQIIVNGVGIAAAGNSSGSYGAGFYITGGTKVSTDNVSNSIGVLIGGGCGGVVFGECDIIACEQNVVFNNSLASANNREQFFTDGCTLDSAGDNNIWVQNNGAAVIDMTGTWCSSSGQTNSGGVGILVNSTQLSAMLIKCNGVRMFNNGGGGIISNGGGLIFVGGLAISNGSGASGGHGIWFPTANTSEKTITGSTIINNGNATTGTGVLIAAGVTNTNIQCNTIHNNAQAQLTDNSGAVNKLIANNLLT